MRKFRAEISPALKSRFPIIPWPTRGSAGAAPRKRLPEKCTAAGGVVTTRFRTTPIQCFRPCPAEAPAINTNLGRPPIRGSKAPSPRSENTAARNSVRRAAATIKTKDRESPPTPVSGHPSSRNARVPRIAAGGRQRRGGTAGSAKSSPGGTPPACRAPKNAPKSGFGET